MKILVFDNYDSFTYNLVHYIRKLGYKDVDVFRNDKISLDEIEKYDKILLSPGPGLPEESGLLLPLIERFSSSKSIMGVCLGHQALAQVHGCELENRATVLHGIATKMKVTENGDKLYDGLPSEFEVGRYHSWQVKKDKVSDKFKVTGVDEEGEIMSIRHKEFDLVGVQYHPESVLTEHGENIMLNWLKN